MNREIKSHLYHHQNLASHTADAKSRLMDMSQPQKPAELFYEFHYIWPVNIGVLQTDGAKDPIACPEFTTTAHCVGYRWQLLLYLSRPFSDVPEKAMGLYLCYKAGPVDYVAIDCEMFLSATDHSRACSNLARKVELEVEGRAWGYASFCPQDLGFLERETKARLINDEKELKVGITIRMGTKYFEPRNFFPSEHSVAESEKLSAYLFEKVVLDYERGAERADCRLVAKDGAGFCCNRAVLEYASPVLHTLLSKTNPFVAKEHAYNEIHIDDLSSPALKEILHFVYKGIPSENLLNIAMEVVHGAHRFQLDRLKTMCEKEMVFQLNEKNAIRFLYTAERYALPILSNMALNMVLDRWPVMQGTKEAESLTTDGILMRKLLQASTQRINTHTTLVPLGK